MILCERTRLRAGLAAALAGIVALAMLLPACQMRPDGRPDAKPCLERLAAIGRALRAYHDEFGCFPPRYAADESGRPLHSWRTLVLTYLGHEEILAEYDFGEPWDGPTNRPLADVPLEAFRCPQDRRPATGSGPTTTSYLAVGGPGTAWGGSEPRRLADLTDGPAETILVVEVADSGILWSEPRDLHVIQMAASVNSPTGQGISSRHSGGAHVLLADGSTVFLPSGVTTEDVRAMLTIAGGEDVDPRKY